MQYLYLGLFIVITGLHLYASLKKNDGLRAITKGLILMMILGFYLESLHAGNLFGLPLSTAEMSWLLVIALMFSWLGDMLLIGKGLKWFVPGGIAFMVSHAFFIATYAQFIDFSKIPLWLIIVPAVVFATVVTILFTKLRQYLKPGLFIPMFFYLLLNGGMNCFALYRLFAAPSLGTILTAVGAVLFFISDCTLFFVRFNKDCRIKSHFPVMLTYSVGEFLIVLGLILA